MKTAERQKLIDAGVEVISDDSGTTGNRRPVVAGLDGDVIRVEAKVKVLLDQGGQFTVSDLDGRIIELRVNVDESENNHLGLDATGTEMNGVYLRGGFVTNGKVLVEGHEIGYLTLSTGELKIDFYDFVTVTSAEVQALVHNLTYFDSATGRSSTGRTSPSRSPTTANVPPLRSCMWRALTNRPTSRTRSLSAPQPSSRMRRRIRLSAPSAPSIRKATIFSYQLLDDAGGRFVLNGNQLLVKKGAVLDYEIAQGHSVRIEVSDTNQNSIEKTFTITLTDVPDGQPNSLTLSATTVDENAPNDTFIGMVSGNDPDGGPLTYALLDDAGGRFVLRGNQLVVGNSALLDYETAQSHRIKLQGWTDGHASTRYYHHDE